MKATGSAGGFHPQRLFYYRAIRRSYACGFSTTVDNGGSVILIEYGRP
jgi:hypothetical protein